MIKNIVLVLFIFLTQSPSYGMLHQEEIEESSQSLSRITHFGQTLLEGENKIHSKSEPKIRKTHVLFLCTGNSCRSQMAEGWARYLGSDVTEVNSAGIKAHGLNPNAVKVMKESGVDITNQTSKIVASDMIQWADLIVTVCGDADENCPRLPSKTKKIHWPIVDPAKAMGTEEEILKQFRTVRDEIRDRVFELLNGFREKL
jgi:arsenate reductase